MQREVCLRGVQLKLKHQTRRSVLKKYKWYELLVVLFVRSLLMRRTSTWAHQEACPAALLQLAARQRPPMSLRCAPDCFCSPLLALQTALSPLFSHRMEAVSSSHPSSPALHHSTFSSPESFVLHLRTVVHDVISALVWAAFV